MKRILTVLGLVLLMAVPSFGQTRSICGDVNDDGTVNIGDLTYLIDYIFRGGSPPVDITAGDMDLCGDIDSRDISYLIYFMFYGGSNPCAGVVDCTLYQQGSLSLDYVSGLTAPGQISIERPVTFYIRLTNNTPDDVTDLCHGFQVYSPDGAQWSSTVFDTTGTLGFAQFDLVNWLEHINVDGSPADTVAIGAFKLSGSGLISGFDDVAYTISIGSFQASDIGKTICLDSAFFPPAGRWVWSVHGQSAYSPPFGGPYCFTIVDEPDAEISLGSVNGLIAPDTIGTDVTIDFDLRFVNNTGETIAGFSNGFRVYSPDGVDFGTPVGDTLGPLGMTEFDLGMGITHFGDTVGFWGVLISSPGMPDGFDDIPFRISIGPIDAAYVGGHVCLDSSFFPPSGNWLWAPLSSNSYYPAWGGPYCFTVAPTPYILDVSPDYLEFTTQEGVNPPMQMLNVTELLTGGNIEFFVTESADWMWPDPSSAITPNPVEVHIDVTGLTPGDYDDVLTFEALDCANTPLEIPVYLTVTEGGTEADSLVIPSISVGQVCGGVQPVMVNLSQPIKGASIPIELPPLVTVDEINFAGLITQSWDYTFTEINNSEGYAFVALANSHGDMIPAGTTTVFNLVFNAGTAECLVGSYMHWDTTLMDDPSHQLLFSDINNLDLLPGFGYWRDSTEVPGYTPGDINGDGSVDISDLTGLVAYLFTGGTPPCVLNAADLNGTCTGPNIADLTYLVDYLFQGGADPVCGCLPGTSPAAKINNDIGINVFYDGEVTIVTLSSPVDLRGVQLELVGTDFGPVEKCITEQLDLITGRQGNGLRIGLVDLDGGEVIGSGVQQLVRIPGKYELVSAVVSDITHQDFSAAIVSHNKSQPVTFKLMQNYPNPFNPGTTIKFFLEKRSDYELTIFNVTGQEVTSFKGTAEPGEHSIVWDASENAGGVYFYRLKTDSFTDTKKMLLLK